VLTTTKVAPEVYRVAVFVPEINLSSVTFWSEMANRSSFIPDCEACSAFARRALAADRSLRNQAHWFQPFRVG
jgi:hypothetical protein